jgi:alpha-mannosidase
MPVKGKQMKKKTIITILIVGLVTFGSCVQKSAGSEQLKHRLDAEIEFAESLCKFYPAQAEQWQKLIEQAKKIVADSNQADKNYYTNVVQGAERILAPVGVAAKTYTIHCIGHAHIDMNWMWSWPETVAIVNDTFTTVLKLMDEFDDFYFSQSQASVYEIIREYNPALFEQIKKRVAQERWEITAAQWVEGDKNLVSGESIARHLLYTRQFMKDNFNLKPEDISLCWEPDAFGHAYSIPTILSKGGIKMYYLCRPASVLASKGDKPHIFWWEGPDGSRLLVFNGFYDYSGNIDTKTIEKMISFSQETGLKEWMKVYGVGDHGGGPTRQDILRCHEMNSWPIYPNFKMGTANKYFETIKKYGDKFPVIKNELNFEFTGCYTSQSEIKQFARLADSQLKNAEVAASLAYLLLDRSWPQDEFKKAWINTLFGQFHDILPGSGVRWTREYQSGLFQDTAATTSMITTNSLRAVAASIDTSFADIKNAVDSNFFEQTAMGAGAGIGTSFGSISPATHFGKMNQPTIVIFNPTMTSRNELVRVLLWDPVGNSKNFNTTRFMVRTSDGRNLKTQTLGSGEGVWGHRYVEVAFPVEIGSMGYTSYAVTQDPNRQDLNNTVQTPDRLTIENEFLKAVFDPCTGGIASFIDKRTGRDLAVASDPLGVMEYILEKPNFMSAWTIDEPIKRICPLKVISVKSK